MQRKTTAYHPQSNGQMEQMNKKIKTYLQKYINHHQNDWPKHLSMLEYVQNTKKSEQHIYILYQIVYDETPAITAIKRIRET